MPVSEHTAGVGDEAMRRATGRHPHEWFAILDAQHASTWTHARIARWIVDHYGDVPGWWVQSVTVRYEQARGMRLPGQQPDGTFTVSSSKSLALDPDAALDVAIAVVGAHTATEPASVNRTAKYPTARWPLTGGQSLLATTTPPRNGKTTLSLTHSRIPGAELAAEAKDTLAAVLANLATPLD